MQNQIWAIDSASWLFWCIPAFYLYCLLFFSVTHEMCLHHSTITLVCASHAGVMPLLTATSGKVKRNPVSNVRTFRIPSQWHNSFFCLSNQTFLRRFQQNITKLNMCIFILLCYSSVVMWDYNLSNGLPEKEEKI